MLDDIKLYADSDGLTQDKEIMEQAGRNAETNEKGHGRIEKRECWLFDEAEWLWTRHDWPFLQGAAVIRSTCTMLDTGEVSSVFHSFLFSHQEMTAERFSPFSTRTGALTAVFMKMMSMSPWVMQLSLSICSGSFVSKC